MNARRFVPTQFGLLLALVACGGDDSPTEPLDALTRAESTALVGIVVYQTTSAFEALDTGGPGSAMVPASGPARQAGAVPIAGTVPRALGGTVAVGGTVSQMGDGGDGNVTLSAALTLAHAACVARDEDTGIVFTVNGDPELAVGFELAFTETAITYSGSIKGSVRWATDDDRSGRCSIDVDVSVAIGADAVNANITGEACGNGVDETVSQPGFLG